MRGCGALPRKYTIFYMCSYLTFQFSLFVSRVFFVCVVLFSLEIPSKVSSEPCTPFNCNPLLFFKGFYLFLERGEGRKKEKEGNIMCRRYIYWLPLTPPQTWTCPTTQARALTGNQNGTFQFAG